MTPADDTVIRMAMQSAILDRASTAVLPAQRLAWLRRLASHAPLTLEERQQIRAPLLAWSHERQRPETTTLLQQQFAEEAH